MAVLTPAAVVVTLERDLLLSSLSRPVGSPPPLSGPAAVPDKAGARAKAAAEVVAHVRRGNYLGALACPAARALLLGTAAAAGANGDGDGDGDAAAAAAATKTKDQKDASETPAADEVARRFFASVESAVEAAGAAAATEGGVNPAAHDLTVLAVGVAALNAFTQANVTGPDLRGAPACPVFRAPSNNAASSSASASASSAGGVGNGSATTTEDDADAAWNRWATGQLSLDGEDLIGRCFLPQYLYLARVLLARAVYDALILFTYSIHLFAQNTPIRST